MEAEQPTEGEGKSTEQLQLSHTLPEGVFGAQSDAKSTDARNRAMRSLTCHNLRASSISIFSHALKYDISPSNELLFRWHSACAAEAVNYECD
ncbi:hypothetical protein QQF64_032251 [Cirrhinus molitorella]|uniref:Uncharacterized protein n=1 Tax=Cirrhinus molitorella TaxID=172907 RepID=A0ABR3MZ95_9TELE